MTRVTNPFIYTPDPDTFRPLDLGSLYVGVEDTDPENPDNQVQVRVIQSDGSTVDIPQPVAIGAGGVPEYNGSPAELDVIETSYSLKVNDSLGSQQYYSPQAGPGGSTGRENLFAAGGLPFDATVNESSAAYTVTDQNYNTLIRYDATAQDSFVNLPSAAIIGDRFRIIVQKIDSSTNTVTIDADGFDLINGEGTYLLSQQWEFVELVCDGVSNWSVIATNTWRNPFEDLASAATTDLGSTISENVNITGTTTITSFGDAPAGTFRRGKFGASLTLTYNATSLILPGDNDIITVADDVFEAVSLGSGNWIVTEYQEASALSGSGVEQTWQDVSGSRAVNTSYQNNTSRPIMVNVRIGSGSNIFLEVSTDNATWIQVAQSSGSSALNMSTIVPTTNYYRINGAVAVQLWAELR